MFETKRIDITVPAGPYPPCGRLTPRKEDGYRPCCGTMLPKVEPAKYRILAEDSKEGKDGWGWQEGTAILYWQCSHCGKRT